MGDRVFYQRVTTDKSPEDVRNAGLVAVRYLGGGTQLTQNGFVIREGKIGASMASLVNLTTYVTIQKMGPSNYEYQFMLHWDPSGWVWFFLVLGIVGGISILLALLYFLFNPTNIYQSAIGRIPYLLEPAKGLYE